MNRPPNIPALTSMRFFAAVYIVFHHFYALFVDGVPALVDVFLNNADLGVTFFFVLSGFILAYTNLSEPLNNGGARRTFWFHRAARIYPVYFIGFLLSAPAFVADNVDLHYFALKVALIGPAAVALVQAWFPVIATAWNPPGWSLSAEAFFYASFPFLFVALSRLNKSLLPKVFVACWVLSVAPTFLLNVYYHFDQALVAGTPKIVHQFVNFNPLVKLPEFVLGIVVCLLFTTRSIQQSRRVHASYLSIISVAALIGALCLDSHWLSRFFAVPACAAVVYFLAFRTGLFSSLLSNRLLVALGEASFAMYILHFPLFRLFQNLQSALNVDWMTPLGFAGYVLGTIAISLVTYYFFEKPLSKLLRRTWSNGWSGRVVTTPAH